ncbi:MAG: AGE family epimerase/isomerase [Verrucomicrobia bacterium]|nr:AGE family epimerase/isomerase [Verrucomicrobiota bacterium]
MKASESFSVASFRGFNVSFILGIFFVVGSATVPAAEPSTGASAMPPAREQLLGQARRCREILRESLVDFYLPACVDKTNGGYLESLRDGQFTLTGEKFLTLQARQLWFFSTLAIEGIDRERAQAAARSGFGFLQSKMRDSQHGGYFSKDSDAGAPVDTRKHAYLNSFALYGLTAYYQATRDAAALAAAQQLFRLLDSKAHDDANGGYLEFFYADWRPVTDPKEPGYVGAIGTKTYNTHLHLLESFAECIAPGPILRCAGASRSSFKSTPPRSGILISTVTSTDGIRIGAWWKARATSAPATATTSSAYGSRWTRRARLGFRRGSFEVGPSRFGRRASNSVTTGRTAVFITPVRWANPLTIRRRNGGSKPRRWSRCWKCIV